MRRWVRGSTIFLALLACSGEGESTQVPGAADPGSSNSSDRSGPPEPSPPAGADGGSGPRTDAGQGGDGGPAPAATLAHLALARLAARSLAEGQIFARLDFSLGLRQP